MNSFLPEQLISKAFWLIKIRWIVGFFTFVVVLTGNLIFSASFNYIYLYITTILIYLFNFLYLIDIKNNVSKRKEYASEKYIKRNIQFQIAIDFVLLTIMLHFSGGIENPCIIFYIFHMIIGSIILNRRGAYSLTILAVFLFISLSVTEYFGVVKHYTLNQYITTLISSDPAYLFFSLGIFVLTSFSVVFIAVTLSGQLGQAKLKLGVLNKNLLEKDKIKDEFVQRVSHDIKGDLATITNCLTIVEKQIVGPVSSQNEEFIEKALKRTNKLTLFVNDLLKLTKMRLDNRFDTTVFSITEVINNVVNQITPFAESNSIQLKWEMPNVEAFMAGIKVSIEEVFFNLIHNAIKYTPSGGKVNVELKKINNKINVVIADTGCGISENDLPYIFDEFFRAENTKHIEGTGLGLSLVKGIIERHNGSIVVKSQEFSGSEFTITLNEATIPVANKS